MLHKCDAAMGEVDTRSLLLDVRTILRKQGFATEAEHLSQAAFAQRGWFKHDDEDKDASRLDQLKHKAAIYDLCFGVLHKTCSAAHSVSEVAPLQQKLWCRLVDVTNELCVLLEQQRQQQESLAGRYRGLRQEHQVLRTNLKSLKHTVQQLLTDVSTLMQHTATTRQQQQQQQELQQQQEQASQQLGAGQWQRQASSSQWKLQQAAHGTVPASAEPGAGSNSNSHCLAGTATRRGANGGRRCVSADGSAPSSATGGGGGRESSSSIVALTMQRLIGSIERMSRHFADCHAGKLIEDYSSTGPAGVAPAAAAAVTAGSQHGSNSRLAENHDGSAVNALGGNSNSCSAAEGCVRGINSDGRPVSSEVTTGLDVTANVGRNSSSNSSSSTGGRHQQPHSSRVRQQQVPRPPSSGSGSSGSGRLRAPGPPVLGGVAAAAAAISTAMANASAPRALSTRPGALNNRPAGLCSNSSLHGSAAATNSSADLHQQQGPLEKPAVDRAEADDGMRHSFDRGQAKAAADAWFAATAHGLGSSLGSRGPAVPGAVAAAASGSGRGELSADQLQQTSRQGSFADSNTPATAGAPCSSSSMKEIAATAAGSGVLGASRGVVAEASDSSSTSSLGPSISEVWQQSSEPHRKNVVAEAEAPAAAAAAAVHTVDPVASATAHNKQHQNLQQQQQQWHQEETRPHGRLQDGHSSAKLSGRPQSAAPAAAPATAYAKPPAKGKGRPGASGPGSSLVRKAATRPPGPHAPASMLPSGPLTAGLHSSAARRRVHSTSYSSTGSRDSIATAFSSGCGSPGQPSGASLGSDSSGWGAAGSSRSNSSCSYRSGHSSSSCASLVPQQQQGRPQNTAGGGRVGGRAAGVSASSSSLGCDAVLIGSAGNSPASTNAATPPAQTPATSAGGVPQAAATGYSGSTGPWSPATAGGRGSSDSYPAHLSPARGGAASGNGCASQHGLTAAAGNPKAVRSLDWSHGGTAVQLAGGVMQQGRPAAGDAPPQHPTGIQQGQQQSSQVPGLPSHNPGGATPGTLQQQAQPQQHQHHLVPVLPGAVTKQQQLQPQPVLPASVGRAQVGLLSPILEEVLGGSCTTTPRTSTSDTGDVAFVGRGALSEGGYRSSKLRSSSCPNAAPGPAQAAAQNGVQAIAGAGNGPVQQHQQTYSSAAGGGDDAVPDACPQQEGGRADSPKAVRSGSVSPPDTAAGKDTSPACKQGKHQDKQHYSVQQQSHEELVQELPCGAAGAAVEGHSATGHCPKQSSATTSLLSEAAAVPSPVGSAGRAGRPAQFRRRSWEGDTSSSHQLLTAFPLDLGPCSHSLDSLDTLLMDTSCCHSEEDHCADLRVSTDGLVTGRKDGMAAYPAGEEDAEGAVGQRSGGRVSAGLDLQDLLAIVLDVMNDKQAADKRYTAAGLAQPTLGQHMQCYVMSKVHSNQAAYGNAMSAILTGLEQHKYVQPEIAVFCRVLSDELDEDYFNHKHLRIRQQLQHLATQALSSSRQHQQPSSLWEHCCGAALQETQLQAMLQGWCAERARMQQLLRCQPAGVQDMQEMVEDWEQQIRQHCACGPGEAVRAGSAVAALLLWELTQQLLHLKPIADAFRAADSRCQGVLDLPQFRGFCRRLSQAMSDDEVQVLYFEELRAQDQEGVTFTAICRALLPAM